MKVFSNMLLFSPNFRIRKKSNIDCIMPSLYNMKGKKETPTIIIVISN